MHLQRSLNILPAAHSNLSLVRIVKTGLLGLDTLLSLSPTVKRASILSEARFYHFYMGV